MTGDLRLMEDLASQCRAEAERAAKYWAKKQGEWRQARIKAEREADA